MSDFILKASPGKGRGVFAPRDFSPGEILFVNPIVELDGDDIRRIQSTTLRDYWWYWTTGGAVVFGLGSMVNHSDAPNVACRGFPDQRLMEFYAAASIATGDELLIDYADTPER